MSCDYAAHRLKELSNFVATEYEGVLKLWLELGVPVDAARERFDKATDHIRHMVADLVDGEQRMRQQVLDSIVDYKKQATMLRDLLDLPVLELDENQTPLAKEEILREELERLEHMKVERLRLHKQLRLSERKLCQRLAMAPHGFVLREDSVPTEQDLRDIEVHIGMLKKEQDRRTKFLSTLHKDILDLMTLLGASPEMDSQLDLEDVCLTQERLTLAKSHLAKLQVMKQEAEEKRRRLVEELYLYWERLETPESYRGSFLEKHPSLKMSDIGALEEELRHCQALKREKLAQFVDHLKQELLTWYDKCGIPERGTRLEGAEYNDSYLESLEKELRMMKSFHSTHETLFAKVEKRERLWSKLKEFEKRARDPSRFNNRGGALLQEEKERKRLQKELPRLEDEIQAYMENAKETEDSIFNVWCNGFTSHMEAQWEEYKEEKENEKQARQRKQQETPFTTKGTKRPASATPLRSVSKVSRLGMTVHNSPRANTPAFKRSTLRRSKGKTQPLRRAATKGTSQPSTSRGLLRGANTTSKKLQETSITSVASYKEFQEALADPKVGDPITSTFVRFTSDTGSAQQHEERDVPQYVGPKD
ncbi:protein regulator of cytokinesis 1-like isoform X1 [Ornithodoros turicata]|uniref:protein regulator of cytokinesis 1-like isoform X1 n=1 Tax=Ornithodoros turicata TaxID=34597 RepID=UPI00313974A1